MLISQLILQKKDLCKERSCKQVSVSKRFKHTDFVVSGTQEMLFVKAHTAFSNKHDKHPQNLLIAATGLTVI